MTTQPDNQWPGDDFHRGIANAVAEAKSMDDAVNQMSDAYATGLALMAILAMHEPAGTA